MSGWLVQKTKAGTGHGKTCALQQQHRCCQTNQLRELEMQSADCLKVQWAACRLAVEELIHTWRKEEQLLLMQQQLGAVKEQAVCLLHWDNRGGVPKLKRARAC